MRAWPIALVATSLVVCTRAASANDPAAAQALFDQAQGLMSHGRWSEACPKLAESQRLDPGGGTLLHLAACREHEGKTATAWAHYQEALAAAKRDGRRDRARVAQGRIDALGPRLRKLRVQVAPEDQKLPGFRVMRDDMEVGPALWDDPFPVDPGTHVIRATADGYKEWSTSVDVPEKGGESVVVVRVPALDEDPSSATDAPSPDPSTRNRMVDATRGDAQRTVAYALGGVGAVGLVVGGVFGVLAFSRKSAADDNCAPPQFTQCTAAGIEAGRESSRFGTISTVAFIAAGAFAAGGAVVYFTAPDRGDRGPRARIAPVVGPGALALSFLGSF